MSKKYHIKRLQRNKYPTKFSDEETQDTQNCEKSVKKVNSRAMIKEEKKESL